MKGMVYRDGKFITILTDTDANALYEKPSVEKKTKGSKVKKKNKPGRPRKEV